MTHKDIIAIISSTLGDSITECSDLAKTKCGSTFKPEVYYKIHGLAAIHGPELGAWPREVRDECFKIPPVTMPKPVGEKLYLWPDGEYRDHPPRSNMIRTHYEDLTDKDREWLRQVYLYGFYIEGRGSLDPEDLKIHPDHPSILPVPYEKKMEMIMNHFSISKRTTQYWVTQEKLTKQAAILKAKEFDLVTAANRQINPSTKYLLITSAQNATAVHEQGWRNMLAYSDFLGAEILVIPYRYKNPTSIDTEKENEFWNYKVVPYLDLARHEVSETLSILSDVRTQPTAAMPLVGIHTLSGEASCIVGHSKMHMTSIPTLDGQHPKMAYTTGAITVGNYTDTKAGKKGNFHHTLGFVIVEIDYDCEHIRHVPICDDGSFVDLVHSVDNGKVTKTEECVAIRVGDIHVGDHDPDKINATVKLANAIVPEYVILDDVFNGHSVNPHEAKDGITRYQNHQNGRASLKNEVEGMLDWLGWFKDEVFKSQLVVVRSNHDDFLDRYIRSNEWTKDITNALEFAEGLTLLLKNQAPKGLIPYYINDRHPGIRCLGLDESFKPGDFEHGYHGHLGANGSKGSIGQYANLSSKTIIAHGHHPERLNGALMVGTSTFLRVGYNVGASNWRQCDVIEYYNGKAQHVLYTNHKFTTFL